MNNKTNVSDDTFELIFSIATIVAFFDYLLVSNDKSSHFSFGSNIILWDSVSNYVWFRMSFVAICQHTTLQVQKGQ